MGVIFVSLFIEVWCVMDVQAHIALHHNSVAWQSEQTDMAWGQRQYYQSLKPFDISCQPLFSCVSGIAIILPSSAIDEVYLLLMVI